MWKRYYFQPRTQRNICLNLVKLNYILIVVTLFRLIWHQTEFRLVTNQLEKCNNDQNFVTFNKIQKRDLCVHCTVSLL